MKSQMTSHRMYNDEMENMVDQIAFVLYSLFSLESLDLEQGIRIQLFLTLSDVLSPTMPDL